MSSIKLRNAHFVRASWSFLGFSKHGTETAQWPQQCDCLLACNLVAFYSWCLSLCSAAVSSRTYKTHVIFKNLIKRFSK